MAVTLTLNFDDAWAARLQPMVYSELDRHSSHPIIVGLLESLPAIETIDDLSPKQQGILLILFDLLGRLQRFEGDSAAKSARLDIATDIAANFPLEVGDA